MSQRLFGTDGVRGKAGHHPLDSDTIRRLGVALVRALPHDTTAPRILIGRDTRESGQWIEQELALAAASAGAAVTSAGVISTPAVAYLTRTGGFDAGIVISASHNPYEDNGIKLFRGGGEKFTEELERHVEGIVADASWQAPSGAAAPLASVDLLDDYLRLTRRVLPAAGRLAGLRIAVDCANGATSDIAPRVFGAYGFEVNAIGRQPDGRNINLECGSTHPAGLQALVRSAGANLGVAFDGDGDRAIFVDHTGAVVDGDAVMFLCARQMRCEGRLRGDAVVATVMSNIGLELALKDLGIELVRCPVGDKYVMEEMIRRDLSLGGEQSGHIIFSEYLYTGDGVITALNVLRIMETTGRSLAELASGLTTYPQVLLNVRVRERADLRQLPDVTAAMSAVESRLAGHGRLLVRYSGTEPLLRIMLEGRDEDEIRRWAEEIAGVVRKRLGSG